MAEIYFARQGETVENISKKSGDTGLSLEERIAAIERMNPHLNGKPIVGGNYTPILVTAPGDDEKMCTANFGQAKTEYDKLPYAKRASIQDIGHQEAVTLLEAIHEFKENYKITDGIGDVNTYGAGALGVIDARGTGLLVEMQRIEALLQDYANARGTDKAKFKVKIKQAYQRLNTKFRPVMEQYITRAKTGHKQSAVYNPNRAMKLANKGRVAPLTSGRKMQAFYTHVTNLQTVSKGLFAFDIALRINNVRIADNKMRSAITEGAGWALSTGIALMGTKIAIALVLGPVGWVLAIVLIGALAVGTDYAGKLFTGKIYDKVSSFNPGFPSPSFR